MHDLDGLPDESTALTIYGNFLGTNRKKHDSKLAEPTCISYTETTSEDVFFYPSETREITGQKLR